MRSVVGLGFCLPLVLAGCAISPTAAPTPSAGLAIQGSVRGGRQPIKNAHIYLFAANTTGYGGAGIAPSTSNASVSLLTGTGVATDGIGGFVTTDANGNFSITGDYTCTANSQVYIYALGGDPGGGTNNPAAGLMAVLGNCPGGTFASSTYVVVNEVSTVAAAYAFAGFATDATHVSSSGTALAQVGIKNAFANAANLANLATGDALASTPGGTGTAPQQEIYAIADILASCVNTNGEIPGHCTTLFANALSAGTSGTQPTDTATAAINIAHNPGANVATLFGLVASSGAFVTTFTQPNDFTVALQFSGGGLNDPYGMAIDGSGSVWIANNGASTISNLTSAGVPVSPSTGYTAGNNVAYPNGIAVDLTGNIWVTNYYANSVLKMSPSGSLAAGPFAPAGMNGPYGIAVDASNSIWISGTGSTSNVTLLSNAGVVQSGFPIATGLSSPRSLAIDAGGNAWVASSSYATQFNNAGAALRTVNGFTSAYSLAIDSNANAWVANQSITSARVSEFKTSDGSTVSGSPFTSGGINTPKAIAIDGSGTAWVGNGIGSLSAISATGVALSPSTGYVIANHSQFDTIAVDGSGNVWAGDSGSPQLTEIIGAAAPVVTPLAQALQLNAIGARP